MLELLRPRCVLVLVAEALLPLPLFGDDGCSSPGTGSSVVALAFADGEQTRSQPLFVGMWPAVESTHCHLE